MDPSECGRNLISAIRDFESAYGQDNRFRDVLTSLREVSSRVEEYVPNLHADEESPGRRAAREAAQESASQENAERAPDDESGEQHT